MRAGHGWQAGFEVLIRLRIIIFHSVNAALQHTQGGGESYRPLQAETPEDEGLRDGGPTSPRREASLFDLPGYLPRHFFGVVECAANSRAQRAFPTRRFCRAIWNSCG